MTIADIDTNRPVVALTFDDGPNNTTTADVLDKLEKYGIRATFFLVGDNITPESEPVVKRAYTMGCEIANHSKTHSDMTGLSVKEIQAEVTYVSEKVKAITGEPTRFFRPPYIAVNDTMYDSIAMPFICGVGCTDWEDTVTAAQRVETTLKQVQDGTIILLHDLKGNSQTVEALDGIIPALLEQGYQFVTVSQLFAIRGIEAHPGEKKLYTHVK